MRRVHLTILVGLSFALPGIVYAQATDVDCSRCVDQTDIAQKAVTKGKLADGAVTTGKLDDRAVTNSKLAGGSVTQGKIRDEAVTTAKIREEAVSLAKVSSELSNPIGTFCMPGMVVVGRDAEGNLVCTDGRAGPASCEDVYYEAPIWGQQGAGFDMRSRTSSSLHFIGVTGVTPELARDRFSCEHDPDAGTLQFGAANGTVRLSVLVDDYGVLLGEFMLNGFQPFTPNCSFAPGFQAEGICAASDSPRDAAAICRALGYASGRVLTQADSPIAIGAGIAIADGDGTWGWAYAESTVTTAASRYSCSN